MGFQTACLAPFAVRLHPIATAVALVLASGAAAAAVSWVGPNDSFWDLAGNWRPDFPSAGEDALLGAFDTELRFSDFSARSGTGTGRLTLSGGSLTLGQASSVGALATCSISAHGSRARQPQSPP